MMWAGGQEFRGKTLYKSGGMAQLSPFQIMWLLIPVLLTLHIAVCLLLVLAILMQLPRSEGLGAAFGGGVTDNIFGAQTTNVLSKFTVWLGIGFFVLTLVLAVTYSKLPASKASAINQELMSAPVPVATPAAPAAPAAPAMPPAPAEKPLETEAAAASQPVTEPVKAVTPEAVEANPPPAPAESPAATPEAP